MYVVAAVSLIALLLTWFESMGWVKNGMRWGFILVTVIAAIHYNYGNDYSNYYDLYEDIVSSGLSPVALICGQYPSDAEIGWQLLCYFFQYLGGFFVMVAVLNVIMNYFFYKFIRDNVELKWRPLAVFIYLFSTSLYLLNFSMMRQGFTVAAFAGIWTLIRERRWLVSLLIIFACTFVHTSAFILLPFAFGGFLPVKRSGFLAVLLLGLFLVFVVSEELVRSIVDGILSVEAFEDYEVYNDTDSTFKFGLGVAAGKLIPFLVFLFHLFESNKVDENEKRLITVACMEMILTIAYIDIMMISRIAIYFTAITVAAIPVAFSKIERGMAAVLLVPFVLTIGMMYIGFFSDPVWKNDYAVFHTIFEAL